MTEKGHEGAKTRTGEAVTIPENRPLSREEVAIVRWLIAHGSLGSPLTHLLGTVPNLEIVSRCGCGCASVDFKTDYKKRSWPIAEATAKNPAGLNCGVILWGCEDAVTALEIYEMDLGSAGVLPSLETLQSWKLP